MNSLDLIILVPIAIGFVMGIFKGLIKELISLAAIVLGIYGAKLLSSWFAGVLENLINISPKTAQPIAFLLLFIAIAVVMLILARLLDKLLSAISLGGLNKFLGGVFGAFKYALIVSVLLNVFDVLHTKFGIVNKETVENSVTYKPLLKVAPQLWDEAKKIKSNVDNDNEK
ncbi:MAG: CvpA family protein [Paludibacter sp.]|nr:CvpA family protein [Paludibacter sp.]